MARAHSLSVNPVAPRILSPDQHPIAPASISPGARQVAETLQDAGHDGLLVGGCVRDLMLGREPKDFDVVTDARPETIRRLFRRARLIGRRFRLAHVRVGREIIEVATYRAQPGNGDEGAADTPEGRVLADNVYGTQEEDALRRDFTVNALYYDPRRGTVIDYVDGMGDLDAGRLRVIGDPERRLREDPVRMLRAVRFAAKLGFQIDPAVAELIPRLAHLIQTVPPARLFEEVLKLFHGGYALETYELLRHYHLFEQLFPLTETSLASEADGFPRTLLARALENTDRRIQAGKPVTPAFLFAALLWEPVRQEARRLMDEEGESWLGALQRAGERVIREEVEYVSIPRRFSLPAREIWTLQARLARRQGGRAYRLLEQKRFRAGYDFLLLRAETGEEEPELAQWWTRFQEVDARERERMLQALGGGGGGRRRRRRPRRRKAAASS